MSDKPPDEIIYEELTLDESALLEEVLSELGESRRRFIGQSSMAVLSALVLEFVAKRNALAGTLEPPAYLPGVADENAVKVAFRVNGLEKAVSVDSRVTLLDALRETLGITGPKKGCDHGQCGACTVMVDGRRVLSCLTLTAQCEGRDVTTIEGIAKGDKLHPMQAAFIKHDGFQCGFCTPGQICSAVALLQEAKNGEASYVTPDVARKTASVQLSDEEIRERMSGNLCRCGAYPNIVAAIREVHTGRPTDPVPGEIAGSKGGAV
ncbi:MAG TPA: 2Fe-2S iron-sulfur cluster-binding protein [Pyrinomonadaceae bacterium]